MAGTFSLCHFKFSYPHPSDPELRCLVLLTGPLALRTLRPALQAVEAWPTVLGYASVLRVESLA